MKPVIEQAFDLMNSKPTKWHVEFDKEWVAHNGTMRALREHGYEAAVYKHVDAKTMEHTVSYVLYKHPHNEIIFETTDPEELNNFINLILPPRS